MLNYKIFIASSSPAKQTAERFIEFLSASLKDRCDNSVVNFEVVRWWQDEHWQLLETALPVLQEAGRTFDYAVCLCYPDDVVEIGGVRQYQTRDNVIFEFGLFLSALGKERTFLVRPDESGPKCRVLTDIGEGAYTPRYKIREESGRIEVDIGSLKAASIKVTDRVVADVKSKQELSTSELRKAAIRAKSIEFQSKARLLAQGGASDTRLLSLASENISDFIRLRASASEIGVLNAVNDLGLYFEHIEDLLDISQLAVRQRRAPENLVKEVWVFADDPLEFSNKVIGRAKNQIHELQQTIAANLAGGVKYTYFVSKKCNVRDIAEQLREIGVPEGTIANRECLEVNRLDGAAFKTFFTIHKFEGWKHNGNHVTPPAKRGIEIYMSALMEERNDLLIKLSPEQYDRIYGALKSLVGHDLIREPIHHRTFFYE